MPQMAPISWVILFLFFSITLILFNILNFYLSTPDLSNIKKIDSEHSIKNISWKW
uniref:ATP synthase F0 subunit 8 n=1 Tax=Cordulegaster boltonii TaxID=126173 RepID=UPI002027C8AC|nr:ATP synthase F0 subunit 8 [Cordulegaster boltonii]UPL65126.1 ATP synthase F0 subunit 8 [Cordulegaster boltonii]